MQAALKPQTAFQETTRSAWPGRIVTGVPTLFLAFDSLMKWLKIQPVTDTFLAMEIPTHLARGIGALQLVCLVVYLIPRTAPLGAVLLTGYLGGAVSLHLRIGSPLFSHMLFPVYVGALLWLGLYLRDARLRSLVRGMLAGAKA